MPAKLLLIEDSRFLRTALEKTLASKGFEVRTAADGEDGLRLANGDEQFDLILLDLFLPKLTGHEVLRQLKGNPSTETVPVLILSGLAKEKERQDLIKEGAADCLPKTLELASVVSRVEECLASQSEDRPTP